MLLRRIAWPCSTCNTFFRCTLAPTDFAVPPLEECLKESRACWPPFKTGRGGAETKVMGPAVVYSATQQRLTHLTGSCCQGPEGQTTEFYSISFLVTKQIL